MWGVSKNPFDLIESITHVHMRYIKHVRHERASRSIQLFRHPSVFWRVYYPLFMAICWISRYLFLKMGVEFRPWSHSKFLLTDSVVSFSDQFDRLTVSKTCQVSLTCTQCAASPAISPSYMFVIIRPIGLC